MVVMLGCLALLSQLLGHDQLLPPDHLHGAGHLLLVGGLVHVPPGLLPLPYTFGPCQECSSASWGKVFGQVLPRLHLLLHLGHWLHGGLPGGALHVLLLLLLLLLAAGVPVPRLLLRCPHH